MTDHLSQPVSGQTWNTEAYAAHGRVNANLASELIALLAPRAGEQILDVGCGDGTLTARIAATFAIVTGIDAAPSMLEAARARGLNVFLHSAESLSFDRQFDAVFSNAALHWLSLARQPSVLAGIYRSLRPQGRFVAEMGGQGNIATVRVALQSILASFNIDAETCAASFFPSPTVYSRLLEAAGFNVDYITIFPRLTPLPQNPNGESPMITWLNTFRNGVLDRLNPKDRGPVVDRIVCLLSSVLSDGEGNWTVDYVRLRFHATKR